MVIREDEDVDYFARLSFRVGGQVVKEKNLCNVKVEVDAPLRKEQYEYLIKQLKYSEAQIPRFVIKGDLSLVVKGNYIN